MTFSFMERTKNTWQSKDMLLCVLSVRNLTKLRLLKNFDKKYEQEKKRVSTFSCTSLGLDYICGRN